MKRKSGDWISFLRHWSSRIVRAALLAGILVIFGGIQGQPALAQTTVTLNTILRATVYVSSVYESPGGPAISCIGSGTLVSSDGLVLTSAHSVVDGSRCRVEDIAISLPVRLNEPPVPSYYADVVALDLGLDLAVLRITRQIDGRSIDEDVLSLPFVEMGDSRQLRLDDTITVVGYEGMGDDSVTFSRGTIIGFIAEPFGGEQAWLKTSATILGPMTGGGAYDAQGRLVGIPITAPASTAENVLDCREVQDTNGDGLVDSRDACVPMGGFVNALRPSSLARGLVRAAQLGIRDYGHVLSDRIQVEAASNTAEPDFGEIRFSPGVNEADQPTRFVERMPAGTNSLYLFFDYRNMRSGLTYELRATRDGDSVTAFSQAPALWSGDTNGLWYIGSSGQVWPNGRYEFSLFIEGRLAQTATILIGGAPEPVPTFSDIVFGLRDNLGNTTGVGYVLGVGDQIAARFTYRDMTDGLPWQAVWYYEGVELTRQSDPDGWMQGQGGSWSISIVPQSGGLLPGHYRLELWIGDRLATLGDLVLAGGQQGPIAEIFSNERFSNQIAGGAPGRTVSESFGGPVSDLYAFVDWSLVGLDTPWAYRWLVDGEVFFQSTESWRAPESGADFWFHLGSQEVLPDGSYTLEILLEGQVFVSRTARIGLGQLPVVAGNAVTGVQLTGQVVDAETGDGISGVMFIVLKAEFSVVDFVWDETQIFGMSLSDSQGRFEIGRLLPYGEFYSVVVVAEGYLPVTADGILLDPEDPRLEDGLLEMRLEMNRDLVS